MSMSIHWDLRLSPKVVVILVHLLILILFAL